MNAAARKQIFFDARALAKTGGGLDFDRVVALTDRAISDIENDDVLADGRIEMDERDVDGDRDREWRVDCCGKPERCERERSSEPDGGSRPDLSSSDGSQAFYGVLAVDFCIHEVIDHVHRGGRQAERDKREPSEARRHYDEELIGEDGRREDEQVLRPLSGSKQSDQCRTFAAPNLSDIRFAGRHRISRGVFRQGRQPPLRF